MSMFNNLKVPYSKEGHNHQLQLIKDKVNHCVPCYKGVDGSFVQIFKIYKFHWAVATKIEQQHCLKNCNKSRIERNVEFDCTENINNLQHITRSSD